MKKVGLFLSLLLLAAMFMCFLWKPNPLEADQDQSGHSSNLEREWKNVPEASSRKSRNSATNRSRQQNCASTINSARDFVVDNTQERRLPKCLIIGFPKCGTYALRSFMTLHPDIVAPNREVSFFTNFYHMGLDWYRRQMPLSVASTITVEKTPNYILSVKALSRIRAFNASIKLIISVRDPVIRLQSSYAHAQAKSKLFNETFESWLTKDDRIASVADYERHIQNVFLMFNSGQVLLIQEERLENEPLSVMRDVEQFLGLCHAFTNGLLVFDQRKGFYCFNQTSPKYQEIVHTLTLDYTNGCFTRSKGRDHPGIGQRLLREIVVNVSPFNEKLFVLVGKRFNWTGLRSID